MIDKRVMNQWPASKRGKRQLCTVAWQHHAHLLSSHYQINILYLVPWPNLLHVFTIGSQHCYIEKGENGCVTLDQEQIAASSEARSGYKKIRHNGFYRYFKSPLRHAICTLCTQPQILGYSKEVGLLGIQPYSRPA